MELQKGIIDLRSNTISRLTQKMLDSRKAKGAPFVYIVFPETINTNVFKKYLLDKKQVLMMPAEIFDDEFAIRLSFGRSLDILQASIKKIDRALEYFL